MLGSGILLLGVPVAIGSCVESYRAAGDRPFVWAAIASCVLLTLLTLAELTVPDGVISRYL